MVIYYTGLFKTTHNLLLGTLPTTTPDNTQRNSTYFLCTLKMLCVRNTSNHYRRPHRSWKIGRVNNHNGYYAGAAIILYIYMTWILQSIGCRLCLFDWKSCRTFIYYMYQQLDFNYYNLITCSYHLSIRYHLNL